MARHHPDEEITYVCELPFIERDKLCRILNQNDKWKELAGTHMGFGVEKIQEFETYQNPTEELLHEWSHSNHTVLELFWLLSKMQHYKSMVPLKQFVPEKYHYRMDNGEENLWRLSQRADANSNSKDLKIGMQNFNQIQSSRDISLTDVVNQLETVKLGTEKIINRSVETDTAQVPNILNKMLVRSPQAAPNVSLVLEPIAGTNCENKYCLVQTSQEELKKAAVNWCKSKILGKGHFATVYRGTWRNRQVVIKKIERNEHGNYQKIFCQLVQSLIQLKSLSSYKPDDNVLSLLGCSIGIEMSCLVYDFMPKGSVEDRLMLRQGTEPLTWQQRHVIATGTAKGLQFLHTVGDKPFIHGNIKTANILLDENFQPKIADFGLRLNGAKMDNVKVNTIHDTKPDSMDKVRQSENLTTKLDIYNYGIVLYELATGLVAYDDNRSENKCLKELVDNSDEKTLYLIKDKKAATENEQVFKNLVSLGKWCSDRSPEQRPEIVLVLRKFDEL